MRKEKAEHSARLPFAASMLIFGTIGLLRRFIDLPSGVIACFRGCWAAFCCCFAAAGQEKAGPGCHPEVSSAAAHFRRHDRL